LSLWQKCVVKISPLSKQVAAGAWTADQRITMSFTFVAPHGCSSGFAGVRLSRSAN